MKKRFIAFFLSALMVVSALTVLSSCADKDKPDGSSGSGNGSGGETTGSGGTAEDQLKPGVPEGVRFDADGEKTPITFAVANEEEYDDLMLRSIKLDADDLDESNTVDAAVAARNAAIEDLLGVEIVVYEEPTGYLRGTPIYTALAAGSEEYDVLCGCQWADLRLCLEGLLANLNNITDDSGSKIDYLSPGKPWWPSYYNDAMLIGSNDARYWMTGDLSLRYIGTTYCFFVNEDLYEQDLQGTKSDLLTEKYGKDTTYGDIYELVSRGDWTLDILSEMVAKAYRDDGDGDSNTAEVWGMSALIWDNSNGMAVSAGVDFSERTSDDKINLLFDSSNTRLVDFMTKMRTLLNSGNVHLTTYAEGEAYDCNALANSHACFVSGRLCNAELYLGDSAIDYYIIPNPKMNFDQKEYRSTVHEGISIYGISTYSQSKAAAAATLELMGYYSYRDVRPIYYDQTLKHQYTTDESSAKMIDLMHDTTYADFIYLWRNSDYFGSGNAALSPFLRNTLTASSSIVQLKKNEGVWKSGLEDLLEDIKKLETK